MISFFPPVFSMSNFYSSLPPPVALILPPIAPNQTSGVGKRRGGSLMGRGGKKFVPAVPEFHISNRPATMSIAEATQNATRKQEGADKFGSNERSQPSCGLVRSHTSPLATPRRGVVSAVQVPPHTGGPLSSNADYDRLFVMRCLPVQARRPRPSPDPKQQIARETFQRPARNATRNATV
jgi:hypothetical protein